MSPTATATVGPVLEIEDITSFLHSLEIGRDFNLINVLQQIQAHYGYLPRQVMMELSEQTRTPMSTIYGVATFYAQFYLEPRGKHTVLACRGTACHVKGSTQVIDAIEDHLGISDGESTEDLVFYFETVACLGTCFLAPVMMIDEEYFGDLTAAKVKKIFADYRKGGK